MGRYIAKRVLIAAVTLLAITFLLFLLMDLLPGSPFNNEKLNEAQKALLEHKYGLDKPFFCPVLDLSDESDAWGFWDILCDCG